MAVFRVERLTKAHDRSGFSCGVPALDRYLAQQASQDQRKRVAVVFVLIDTSATRIAGYYTLSASDVGLDALPESARKRLPLYENVPTALLGRLAVDERYRGHSLGKLLLADALRCVASAQQHVGIWGISVTAIDDSARSFYEHFGFTRIPDEPYHLFVPLASILPLLSPEEIPSVSEDERTYEIDL